MLRLPGMVGRTYELEISDDRELKVSRVLFRYLKAETRVRLEISRSRSSYRGPETPPFWFRIKERRNYRSG